jgi:peptide/nickel transport system permease protein
VSLDAGFRALPRPARAAAAFLVLACALAAAGAFLPETLVQRIDLARRLVPPGSFPPLGSDELGRSILFRLWRGASLSLGVAATAVAFSAFTGSTLGLVAGERGGPFDAALGKAADLVLAFPGLLLAVALAAVLGPSAFNTVLALSAVGWVPYARLARTEARRVSTLDYVSAARSAGAGQARLLRRHVLPNIAAPLVVQATLHLAGAILAESALSFLGVGVPPPVPSWGAMLAAGRTHILDAPHVVLVPAAAILLVVLATNVVGDALVERLDAARNA